MATLIKDSSPLAPGLCNAVNKLKAQLLANRDMQSGTSTLSGGTVTVTGVTIGPSSIILAARNAAGGTEGLLDTGTRTNGLAGTGSFVITSSNVADTSTVDWVIWTPTFHLDQSEVTITLATPTDQPTVVAAANECWAVYEFHRVDALAHKATDATNAMVLGLVGALDAGATQLAAVVAMANQLKAKFNAHRTQSGKHYLNDSLNNISAANATDLASVITLVTAIQAALLAHVASGPSAPSLRLVTA